MGGLRMLTRDRAVSAEEDVPKTRPIDRPEGWLDAWRRPEALMRMREARNKARIRWLVTTLGPLAVGLATGLLIRGHWNYDMESGVVLGAVAALILQLWALPPVISRHGRPWEGTVLTLREVRLPRRALSDGFYPSVCAVRERTDVREKYVTEYAVLCRTNAGRKRAIRFLDDAERYRYFAAGDRVRFCPALGTFEKWNRAGDTVIFCPLCGAQSAPGHAHCDGCGILLFGERLL